MSVWGMCPNKCCLNNSIWSERYTSRSHAALWNKYPQNLIKSAKLIRAYIAISVLLRRLFVVFHVILSHEFVVHKARDGDARHPQRLRANHPPDGGQAEVEEGRDSLLRRHFASFLCRIANFLASAQATRLHTTHYPL